MEGKGRGRERERCVGIEVGRWISRGLWLTLVTFQVEWRMVELSIGLFFFFLLYIFFTFGQLRGHRR